MSFLDKFNNWYVRSIPESETGVTIGWMEPVAGAHYRWKAKRGAHVLWMIVFFVLILFLPTKSESSALSLELRLVVAVAFCGIYVFTARARQGIVLSDKQVLIGGGRKPIRILFQGASLALEERDRHPVLTIVRPSNDPELIFVDPDKQSEVKDLLTKAGLLKP